MKLIADKSRLKGTVAIPGSKSHTIRAVAIASLAKGNSVIRRPLASSDTLSAVDCYRALGADIDTSDPAEWQVTGNAGNVTTPADTIDVGNSGTTLRVAMGSAALAEPGKTITLTGDHQIQSRPIDSLMTALQNLGANCKSLSNNGKAPLTITGRLKGGQTPIEAFTSQYLSSLLLCTPLAQNDTEIDVTLLNEPGYVQLTLDWLDKQNIKYQHDGFKHFSVRGGQSYKPFDLPIPADFSSATFFLCAAALLADEVTLTGLDFSDAQPDKAVVDYLKQMGADITVTPDSLVIKAAELTGADIDMNATPDALPALAVTAAFAKGTTRLLNVPQARSKETDRIACMAAELAKLNVKTEELPDGLIIHGSTPTPTSNLTGRDDHRIVMALSIAGLAIGLCDIDTAEAMNVTFPNYVNLMTTLGANMKTSE